jgi:hypothetical protein
MAAKPKKPGTAVVAWDEALAARAAIAKKSEASVSTGSFISVKGAQMTYQGNPVDGNKMDVVIIDSIMENKYYEGKYDPNNAQGPACYAFGRDEDDMKPHDKVADPISDSCVGCPNNEWDSGDGGKGKACKNIRRLAVIPADVLDGGPEAIATAEVAYLEVPVTSVKAWAGFVNQLAASKKPPLAFITEISVAPDAKTQLKVSFKAQSAIEDGELLGALLDKADIVEKGIDFPYQAFEAKVAKPTRKPAAASRGRSAPAPAKAASRRKF